MSTQSCLYYILVWVVPGCNKWCVNFEISWIKMLTNVAHFSWPISLSVISKSVEFESGNLSRAVSICQELPKKNQDFWSFGLAGPPTFAFTKEILKNTKENLKSNQFCPHFLQ